MPPPPALTYDDLLKMPEKSKVEVYVRGTGFWIAAQVVHTLWATIICPTDDDMAHAEVVIHDSLTREDKDRLTLLVRPVTPKRVEVEPGPYRLLLEDLSLGLVEIIRTNRHKDDPSPSLREVQTTVRHLLKTGGFLNDLWIVFNEVVKEEFTPEDSVLGRIIEELKKEQK